MYAHICLEKINNLYKYSGKYDDQQKYKSITEAEIVSTNEELTEKIPMYVGKLGTMKDPSEINPPRQFLELLDITQKTAVQNGSCQKITRHPYIQCFME